MNRSGTSNVLLDPYSEASKDVMSQALADPRKEPHTTLMSREIYKSEMHPIERSVKLAGL